jgi:hypothetical protein
MRPNESIQDSRIEGSGRVARLGFCLAVGWQLLLAPGCTSGEPPMHQDQKPAPLPAAPTSLPGAQPPPGLPRRPEPAIELATFVTSGSANLQAQIPDQGPGVRYQWTLTGGTIQSGDRGRTIRFTAGAQGPLRVAVTLDGPWGSVTGQATATVVPAPIAPLEVPEAAHPDNVPLTAQVPKQPGMTYRWQLRPGATRAALGAGADSAAVTFTPGDQEGQITLQVEVRNQAMDTATAARSVAVQRGIWLTRERPGGGQHPGGRISASLLAHGSLLVAGGRFPLPGPDAGKLVTAAIHVPASHTWTAANLPDGVALQDHTAVPLPDGTLLVVGITEQSQPVALCYSPAIRSWARKARPTAARFLATATLLQDGHQVLLAGGEHPGVPATHYRDAALYDRDQDRWQPTAPMAFERSGHTATLLDDGRILAVGGGPGPAEGSAECFDPQTGQWSPTGPLATGRNRHTATRLPDGRVLVTGGQATSTGTPAECFDPGTGHWTQTGAPRTGRIGHAATSLGEGQVLVTGGRSSDSDADVRVAEIYHPATGTWSDGGTMLRPRYGHQAVRMGTDSVLAVFGQPADLATECYMAPRPEPRAAPRPQPQPEPRAEPRPEPRPEPRAEPQPEPQPQPRPEPRAAPQPEPQPDPHLQAGPAEDDRAPAARVGPPTLEDYATLGLDPHRRYTPYEVRICFRRLAKRWHPDRNPGPSMAYAQERCKAINGAYERIYNAL